MRKIIVTTFLTLDGVMQAPGGPEEDQDGEFSYGGWSVGYWDDILAETMGKEMSEPFEYLLGRKTYQIFASHWPHVGDDDEGAVIINNTKKYVVSKSLSKVEWQNSILINKNIEEEIKSLKDQDGPDLQVAGSSNLIQYLLKHELVDEFWLKIYPVVIGNGKRLFGNGTIPMGFNLRESKSTPSGVIIATYERDGEIKTGSFALE